MTTTTEQTPAIEPFPVVCIADIPDELAGFKAPPIREVQPGDLLGELEELRALDEERRGADTILCYHRRLCELPDDMLLTLEVLMYTGRELRWYPDSAQTGRWLLRAYAWDSRATCRAGLIDALHKTKVIEDIDRGIAFARQHAPELLRRGARPLIGLRPPRRTQTRAA